MTIRAQGRLAVTGQSQGGGKPPWKSPPALVPGNTQAEGASARQEALQAPFVIGGTKWAHQDKNYCDERLNKSELTVALEDAWAVHSRNLAWFSPSFVLPMASGYGEGCV